MDPDSETIGAIFKRLRGETAQSAIALQADIKQTTLSDYEHGKIRPSPGVARRILKALGADAETVQRVADDLRTGPMADLRAVDEAFATVDGRAA